uniref:hypothetical protein n=1 Tax=Rhodanobacter thiooxydans TaxID=416169 RepID=UPI00131F042D
ELFAPLLKLQAPRVMLFCSSCSVADGNIDVFLINTRAKSLGTGAFCSDARVWKGNAEILSSDAGAKTLDDGVLHLAQEATEGAGDVSAAGVGDKWLRPECVRIRVA